MLKSTGATYRQLILLHTHSLRTCDTRTQYTVPARTKVKTHTLKLAHEQHTTGQDAGCNTLTCGGQNAHYHPTRHPSQKAGPGLHWHCNVSLCGTACTVTWPPRRHGRYDYTVGTATRPACPDNKTMIPMHWTRATALAPQLKHFHQLAILLSNPPRCARTDKHAVGAKQGS